MSRDSDDDVAYRSYQKSLRLHMARIAALEAENVALRAALGDIASHGCLRHGDEGWTCRQEEDGEPECEVCMAAVALDATRAVRKDGLTPPQSQAHT